MTFPLFSLFSKARNRSLLWNFPRTKNQPQNCPRIDFFHGHKIRRKFNDENNGHSFDFVSEKSYSTMNTSTLNILRLFYVKNILIARFKRISYEHNSPKRSKIMKIMKLFGDKSESSKPAVRKKEHVEWVSNALFLLNI